MGYRVGGAVKATTPEFSIIPGHGLHILGKEMTLQDHTTALEWDKVRKRTTQFPANEASGKLSFSVVYQYQLYRYTIMILYQYQISYQLPLINRANHQGDMIVDGMV